jgi:hypothetical protein
MKDEEKEEDSPKLKVISSIKQFQMNESDNNILPPN